MSIWILGERPPASAPEFVNSVYPSVVPYLTEFLTAKHPYRKGAMCPFMPQAIEEKRVYFSYCDGTSEDCRNVIKKCIKHHRENKSEVKSSYIILFRQGFEIPRLLRLHIENKIRCIKNAIMIGALYSTSMAPSLHSEKYFPLRTPSPILVLRDLTPSDLVFLEPGHYSSWAKYGFLRSFIKEFSSSNSGYAKRQVDLARQLMNKYKKGIIKSLVFWLCGITVLAITVLFVQGWLYVFKG